MAHTHPTPSATDSAIDTAIEQHRDALVHEWLNWIEKRLSASESHQALMRRQLRLLVDVLAVMAGPLRRSATNLWFNVCESYGRTSALRGLAAGEVVEELQYLRELLIRALADTLTKLPPRQAMATILRLNRVVDKGIADAVVGYTDSLIVTLFSQRGVPVPVPDSEADDTAKQIEVLEQELHSIRKRG